MIQAQEPPPPKKILNQSIFLLWFLVSFYCFFLLTGNSVISAHTLTDIEIVAITLAKPFQENTMKAYSPFVLAFTEQKN